MITTNRLSLFEGNRAIAAEWSNRVYVCRSGWIGCGVQHPGIRLRRAHEVYVSLVMKVVAPCSNIADIKNGVLPDFTLHPNRPLLNLRSHKVRINTTERPDRQRSEYTSRGTG